MDAVGDVATTRQDEGDAGETIAPGEVLKRIPHRYPFLLVDRAVDYRPMTSIRGIKNVTFNEPFFQGHFPGLPIMPGVLIVEALAQTGAILMSKSLDVDVERHTIFFMSVDRARFRHPVRPGDVLQMDVTVLVARRGVFKFDGRATVNGQRAAEAEFAAKVHEIEP